MNRLDLNRHNKEPGKKKKKRLQKLVNSPWEKYVKVKFRALAARYDKISELLGGRKWINEFYFKKKKKKAMEANVTHRKMDGKFIIK